MITVGQSLGSGPILVLELFPLVPRLFGTTCHCLSAQPVQLLPSRDIWRHISLLWPFPIDTVTPHGLLMLRKYFLDFAVEHWLGCHATEPGFARNIGALEVWLIGWFDRTNSAYCSHTATWWHHVDVWDLLSSVCWWHAAVYILQTNQIWLYRIKLFAPSTCCRDSHVDEADIPEAKLWQDWGHSYWYLATAR